MNFFLVSQLITANVFCKLNLCPYQSSPGTRTLPPHPPPLSHASWSPAGSPGNLSPQTAASASASSGCRTGRLTYSLIHTLTHSLSQHAHILRPYSQAWLRHTPGHCQPGLSQRTPTISELDSYVPIVPTSQRSRHP